VLKPIYFCLVENVDIGFGNIPKISTSPLPSGINYTVIAYSQVDGYTLIKWQQGTDEEYFTGETLWLHDHLIVHSGGALSLYAEQEEIKGDFPPDGSIWSSVNKNVGNYGLSSLTAIALRKVENTVYF
jgi:hypothetical protein